MNIRDCLKFFKYLAPMPVPPPDSGSLVGAGPINDDSTPEIANPEFRDIDVMVGDHWHKIVDFRKSDGIGRGFELIDEHGGIHGFSYLTRIRSTKVKLSNVVHEKRLCDGPIGVVAISSDGQRALLEYVCSPMEVEISTLSERQRKHLSKEGEVLDRVRDNRLVSMASRMPENRELTDTNDLFSLLDRILFPVGSVDLSEADNAVLNQVFRPYDQSSHELNQPLCFDLSPLSSPNIAEHLSLKSSRDLVLDAFMQNGLSTILSCGRDVRALHQAMLEVSDELFESPAHAERERRELRGEISKRIDEFYNDKHLNHRRIYLVTYFPDNLKTVLRIEPNWSLIPRVSHFDRGKLIEYGDEEYRTIKCTHRSHIVQNRPAGSNYELPSTTPVSKSVVNALIGGSLFPGTMPTKIVIANDTYAANVFEDRELPVRDLFGEYLESRMGD